MIWFRSDAVDDAQAREAIAEVCGLSPTGEGTVLEGDGSSEKTRTISVFVSYTAETPLVLEAHDWLRATVTLEDTGQSVRFDVAGHRTLLGVFVNVHRLFGDIEDMTVACETIAAYECSLLCDGNLPDPQHLPVRIMERAIFLKGFAWSFVERLDRLLNHLQHAPALGSLVVMLNQKAAECQLKVIQQDQAVQLLMEQAHLPSGGPFFKDVAIDGRPGEDALGRHILTPHPTYRDLRRIISTARDELEGARDGIATIHGLSQTVIDRMNSAINDSLNNVMFWIGVATFVFGIVAVLDKYQSAETYGVAINTAFPRLALIAVGVTVLAIFSLARSGVTPLARLGTRLRDGWADRIHGFSLLHGLRTVLGSRPDRGWYHWFERRSTEVFQGALFYLGRAKCGDDYAQLARAERFALKGIDDLALRLSDFTEERIRQTESVWARSARQQARDLEEEAYLALAFYHLLLDRPEFIHAPLVRTAFHLMIAPLVADWLSTEEISLAISHRSSWLGNHFEELASEYEWDLDDDESARLGADFQAALLAFLREEASLEGSDDDLWGALGDATDMTISTTELAEQDDETPLRIREYLLGTGDDPAMFDCIDFIDALKEFSLAHLLEMMEEEEEEED